MMVYNINMNHNYAPKNYVEPYIIKNFFSKEELNEILSIVERQKVDKTLNEFYSPLILKHMARMQIEVMYPPHLIEKLETFASNIVGEDVKMNHNSYLSYNKIHNPEANPKLPPHFDSDNYYSKLTLDYQLDKNVDWVIRIEEKSFNLEYGDLLVFWGSGEIHWREPLLFKNGDNTEVLTMHFSTQKDFEEFNLSSRTPEERQKRLDMWNSNPKFIKYQEEYANKQSLLQKG